MAKSKTVVAVEEQEPTDARLFAASFEEPVEKDGLFYGAVASTRKGQDCVVKILEATRTVLIEHGYGGLTLRLVGERAQIAHSNVQYYYPTKERLIDGLMAYGSALYRRDMARQAKEWPDDPEEQLRAFVRFYIEDDRNLTSNVIFYEMRAMSQRNDTALDILDRNYQRYRRRIELLIGAVNPDVSAAQRALRAAVIVSLIDGLMIFIGARAVPHPELTALADEAEREIMRIAKAPAEAAAAPAPASRRKRPVRAKSPA